MLNRNCFVLALLVVLAASAMCADTGVLTFKVRDAETHYAVRAKITIEGPESLSIETDETGSTRLSLPEGRYQVAVSAPGYKTMTFPSNVGPGNNMPWEVTLDS